MRDMMLMSVLSLCLSYPSCASGKLRCLFAPAFGRHRPPAAGIAAGRALPAERFILDVHRLIVVVEELDAMAVRIAQIEEARIAGTEMPPRTPFDLFAETGACEL